MIYEGDGEKTHSKERKKDLFINQVTVLRKTIGASAYPSTVR